MLDEKNTRRLVEGHSLFVRNPSLASYSRVYDLALPFLWSMAVAVEEREGDTVVTFKSGARVVLPQGDAVTYVGNVAHYLSLSPRKSVQTVPLAYREFIQKVCPKKLVSDLELVDLVVPTEKLIEMPRKVRYYLRKTEAVAQIVHVRTPKQVDDCMGVVADWETHAKSTQDSSVRIGHVRQFLTGLEALVALPFYRFTVLGCYIGDRCVGFAVGTMLREGVWATIARMVLRDVDKNVRLDPFVWNALAQRFADVPVCNDGAGGGTSDGCHAHKEQMGCVPDTVRVVNLKQKE